MEEKTKQQPVSVAETGNSMQKTKSESAYSAPKPTTPEAQKKAKQKAAAKAYRDKYFAYYDDVKTKIHEDW